MNRTDPTTPLYFRAEERKGGPTAVIYGFESAYDKIYGKAETKKYAEHPFYECLNKLHLKLIKEIMYEIEHPGGFNAEGKAALNKDEKIKVIPKKEEAQASEGLNDEDELERKRKKCCDDVFGEYLGTIARKVRKEYYARILSFVLLLRECVNQNSKKLLEDRKLLPGHLFPKNDGCDHPSRDYCCTNNAEQVPDICNEFVLGYFEEKKMCIEMDTPEAVELTQNMCHWMFINGYTCSKISLIQ